YVPLIDDNVYEQREEFSLQCTVVGGESPPLAAINIIDDERPPVVSIGDATVLEPDYGETVEMLFPVTLDHPSSDPIRVVYRVADGTATYGDYWNQDVSSVA